MTEEKETPCVTGNDVYYIQGKSFLQHVSFEMSHRLAMRVLLRRITTLHTHIYIYN